MPRSTTRRGARTLTEVRLFEVSPGVFPMNPEARVTAIKAAEEFETMSEREFEHLLREAGLPKAFATAVTLHGFKKASADLRDAGGARFYRLEYAEGQRLATPATPAARLALHSRVG